MLFDAWNSLMTALTTITIFMDGIHNTDNVTAIENDDNLTVMLPSPQPLIPHVRKLGETAIDTQPTTKTQCEDLTRVVGYYSNTARNRKFSQFTPRDIPTNHYTDIIYGYFALNDDGFVRYSNPMIDLNFRSIEHTVALRGQGKVERVLFSIGGWAFSGKDKRRVYSDEMDKGSMNKNAFEVIWGDVLKSDVKRRNFILSAIAIMNNHNFDGIDVNYQYPGCPQKRCSMMLNDQNDDFVKLLTELRQFVGPNKIISITLPGSETIIENLNLKAAIDIVNYTNVIFNDQESYESNSIIKHEFSITDVKNVVMAYASKNCDMSKLNLGIPFYGRGYKVTRNHFNEAMMTKKFKGLPSTGPSKSTKWTVQPGIVAYYQMRLDFPSNSYILYVQDEGSWLIDENENEIVCFVDRFDIKTLNILRQEYDIHGLAVFTIDQDDFDDFNGNGQFPLSKVLNEC
jgi:chitinase